MNKGPLYPALCLILGGALSLFELYILATAGNQNKHRLLILVAGAGFALLIPLMLRGDPWQKMVAGALLFVPSFGLLAAVMD